MSYLEQKADHTWLLFFSSLPSKPVGNRVKVWRKLVKSGAIQLNGTVYVLPESQGHVEFFQWLATQIGGMGGEAAFVRVQRVETIPDEKIVALFERRKMIDYQPLREALDLLERKIDDARQGARAASAKPLQDRLTRLERDFAGTRRTDFFASAAGRDLAMRIEQVQTALVDLAGAAERAPRSTEIPARSPDAYRGRHWVTRRDPFSDRMASAWLIRKFIDPAATFGFIAEEDVAAAGAGVVAFDVRGGEFTHVDDLCTFEVLARAFGLNNAALENIVEIVHDLDLKDDRYRRAECPGIEAVLDGIRRTATDDANALERGMAIFEMLFAAG